MSKKDKPGFGRIGVAVLAMLGFGLIMKNFEGDAPRNFFSTMTRPPVPTIQDKFNLIFALGNTEKISATGLTWAECEKRKKELKQAAEGLGTYNEKLGIGSITCISEHAYD